MSIIDSTSIILVGALTILAVLLRLQDCSTWWLNPDEGIYFSISIQPSLTRVIAGTVAHVHPPLYYILLWSLARWTQDFQTLRLLSIICGSLCVPTAFLLSLIATSPKFPHETTDRITPPVLTYGWRFLIALACATFVALSPACITLSSVLRPYSLLLLLSLIAITAALRSSEGYSSRWTLLYQISISLALLTHYSAVLVMGILTPLWQSRRTWWNVNRDVLIVLGFVFAINLQFVLQRPVVWNFRKTYLGNQFIDSTQSLFRLIGELFTYNTTAYLGIAIGTLWLLSIVGEFIARRTMTSRVILASFLFPILLSLIKAYPFGGSRHTHYLIPFLILGITIGLWKRPWYIGIFLAIWVLSPFALHIIPEATHPVSEERTLPTRELIKIQSTLSAIDWNEANLVLDEQTRFTLGPWIKERLFSIIPKDRVYTLKDHWVLGIAAPLRNEIQMQVPVKNPADQWYVLISGWNTDNAFISEGIEPTTLGFFNIGRRSPSPTASIVPPS